VVANSGARAEPPRSEQKRSRLCSFSNPTSPLHHASANPLPLCSATKLTPLAAIAPKASATAWATIQFSSPSPAHRRSSLPPTRRRIRHPRQCRPLLPPHRTVLKYPRATRPQPLLATRRLRPPRYRTTPSTTISTALQSIPLSLLPTQSCTANRHITVCMRSGEARTRQQRPTPLP
jgi:hypothetical protein